MNKTELIEAAAKKAGASKKKTAEVLEALLEVTISAIEEDEVIGIKDFGCLKTMMRPERAGRNPITGEPIMIPAGKVVKFRPGKNLVKALKNYEEVKEGEER